MAHSFIYTVVNIILNIAVPRLSYSFFLNCLLSINDGHVTLVNMKFSFVSLRLVNAGQACSLYKIGQITFPQILKFSIFTLPQIVALHFRNLPLNLLVDYYC